MNTANASNGVQCNMPRTNIKIDAFILKLHGPLTFEACVLLYRVQQSA